MDLRAIVATRTELGGAAIAPMQQMMAECRTLLAQMRQWHANSVRQVTAAEANLVRVVHELTNVRPAESE